MCEERAPFEVWYDGELICKINEHMVKKQQCHNMLPYIRRLHVIKKMVFDSMEKTNNPIKLKILAEQVKAIEFSLQLAWGFPQNENYHKFWELPKCTCPKMDNYDRWPTGYYVINNDCPIHSTSNQGKGE